MYPVAMVPSTTWASRSSRYDVRRSWQLNRKTEGSVCNIAIRFTRDFGNYITFYRPSIINCVILHLIDFVKLADWCMKIKKRILVYENILKKNIIDYLLNFFPQNVILAWILWCLFCKRVPLLKILWQSFLEYFNRYKFLSPVVRLSFNSCIHTSGLSRRNPIVLDIP